MNEAAQKAIDKLAIIKELAQQPETQQIAKVMMNYIQDTNKEDTGFKAEKK